MDDEKGDQRDADEKGNGANQALQNIRKRGYSLLPRHLTSQKQVAPGRSDSTSDTRPGALEAAPTRIRI